MQKPLLPDFLQPFAGNLEAITSAYSVSIPFQEFPQPVRALVLNTVYVMLEQAVCLRGKISSTHDILCSLEIGHATFHCVLSKVWLSYKGDGRQAAL